MRSSADVFYYSKIEFIQGRYNKTLTDALLIDRFKMLEQNMAASEQALRIAQAIDCFLPYSQKEPAVWPLVKESFFNLNYFSRKEGAGMLVFHHFIYT